MCQNTDVRDAFWKKAGVSKSLRWEKIAVVITAGATSRPEAIVRHFNAEFKKGICFLDGMAHGSRQSHVDSWAVHLFTCMAASLLTGTPGTLGVDTWPREVATFPPGVFLAHSGPEL